MNFLFPYMARWKAINWTRYHQIFTRLAEEGHNVYVLQPPSLNMIETNFQEIDIDVPENLHLIDVKLNAFIWKLNFPFNKLIKKGYYSLICARQTEELIRKYQIDVLLVYNIPQYSLMNTRLCMKVFDYCDDYIAMLKYEMGRLAYPFLLKYAQRILNKMIEQSDVTLVVSHVLAESLTKFKNTRIEVLPNGVDFRDSEVSNFGKAIPQYKKPIIGFIGSFEYFIDFDLILAAAEQLKDYTILLVGSGRDFEYVRNQVQSRNLTNVILTGAVPHQEVTRYISEMDICLNIFKKIPISHGACPIKLFEYLSMKKPVVSTRLNELNNIDTGFLLYADTKDELICQIEKILGDKKFSTEYIEKGYNITKTQYNWDYLVQRFVCIIKETRRH